MTRKSKPPIALYSALADATRCRIVEILLAGPIPVHTLAEAFSISRPAISRHLRVLKTAGLVAEVKKGRENLYALRPAKLAPATNWINTIVAPAATEQGASLTSPPSGVAKVQAAPSVQPSPVDTQQAGPALSPVVETPVPEVSRAEKAPRTPRMARPEPAVSQMGFDF